MVSKGYYYHAIESNGANTEIQATESNVATQTWITVKSIASYCLVSRSTVWRWVKEGKLSAMKLPSGHYRVTVGNFRDFLRRYDMPIKEDLVESKSKNKGGS